MADLTSSDLGLRAISLALDGLAMRQQITANNIANVDTPGYKAQSVDFEAQLSRALRGTGDETSTLVKTDEEHLDSHQDDTALIAVNRRDGSLRNDTNNVDIDLEMTSLAETTVRYQALAQLAGTKLNLIRSVVRDSR